MSAGFFWDVFSNVLASLLAAGVLAVIVKGHSVARLLIHRALRRIASDEAAVLREEWEAEIAAVSRVRAVRFAFGLWFKAGAINIALGTSVAVTAAAPDRHRATASPAERFTRTVDRVETMLRQIAILISAGSLAYLATGAIFYSERGWYQLFGSLGCAWALIGHVRRLMTGRRR